MKNSKIMILESNIRPNKFWYFFTEELSVQFSLVDNGLENHFSSGSATNKSGFGSPGPYFLAVGSSALVMSRLFKGKSGTFITIINILGLNHFEVLVLGTLFGMRYQFGSITNHILGELVHLVGYFADTIDGLFFGLPKLVDRSAMNLITKIK